MTREQVSDLRSHPRIRELREALSTLYSPWRIEQWLDCAEQHGWGFELAYECALASKRVRETE